MKTRTIHLTTQGLSGVQALSARKRRKRWIVHGSQRVRNLSARIRERVGKR